jgi:hypothetical protein
MKFSSVSEYKQAYIKRLYPVGHIAVSNAGDGPGTRHTVPNLLFFGV